MDGKRCVRGRRENGGVGIGVSLPDCVHGDNGFLFGEPEGWIFVEQRVGGWRAVRSFGLRIHVLGGDAAFEYETRTVFVGSGNNGRDYAHCVRGIADCAECEEVFELSGLRASGSH